MACYLTKKEKLVGFNPSGLIWIPAQQNTRSIHTVSRYFEKSQIRTTSLFILRKFGEIHLRLLQFRTCVSEVKCATQVLWNMTKGTNIYEKETNEL